MTSLHCRECGYSEMFRTGVGMHHSSLDRCLGEFPYWKRQKLEALLEEKEMTDYHFSLVLAQCQTCLSLMEKPHIEFLFSDGSRAHNEMRCNECQSETVRIIPEEWMETARCPFCREKSLEKGEVEGMWD